MSDLIEKEIYTEEYVGKIYKKFRLYNDIKREKYFRRYLKILFPDTDINPYQLYALKILDLLDTELKIPVPFDQYYGYSPIKSIHSEGNIFTTSSEIYNVVNELSIKLKNSTITENIVSRVRMLAIVNDWCPLINFDTYEIDYSDKYFKEVKRYLGGHKKYMRYARLLKVAIADAKLQEHPDILPSTEENFIEFLMSPFVYVMLQPYNYILKDENCFILERIEELLNETDEIIKGVIIDGEIEF
jgi:hypothetical protein